MVLEQSVSPENWYSFRYYGCFPSFGGEIPQTNSTVAFVKIDISKPMWFLFHLNLNGKSNAEISYFTTRIIYWEICIIPK